MMENRDFQPEAAATLETALRFLTLRVASTRFVRNPLAGQKDLAIIFLAKTVPTPLMQTQVLRGGSLSLSTGQPRCLT